MAGRAVYTKMAGSVGAVAAKSYLYGTASLDTSVDMSDAAKSFIDRFQGRTTGIGGELTVYKRNFNGTKFYGEVNTRNGKRLVDLQTNKALDVEPANMSIIYSTSPNKVWNAKKENKQSNGEFSRQPSRTNKPKGNDIDFSDPRINYKSLTAKRGERIMGPGGSVGRVPKMSKELASALDRVIKKPK